VVVDEDDDEEEEEALRHEAEEGERGGEGVFERQMNPLSIGLGSASAALSSPRPRSNADAAVEPSGDGAELRGGERSGRAWCAIASRRGAADDKGRGKVLVGKRLSGKMEDEWGNEEGDRAGTHVIMAGSCGSGSSKSGQTTRRKRQYKRERERRRKQQSREKLRRSRGEAARTRAQRHMSERERESME